jgi:hypothetical protein
MSLLCAGLFRIGSSDKLLREQVPATAECNTGALPCFIKFINAPQKNILSRL